MGLGDGVQWLACILWDDSAVGGGDFGQSDMFHCNCKSEKRNY
jgi:hypothetical protein